MQFINQRTDCNSVVTVFIFPSACVDQKSRYHQRHAVQLSVNAVTRNHPCFDSGVESS